MYMRSPWNDSLNHQDKHLEIRISLQNYDA
jgi:hypothetical protein